MRTALLLLLLLLLASCGGGARTPRPGEKLVVMAATTHLAALAMAVAGESATVQLLPREGTDPHSFEATAEDRRRLESAHLLLVNGLKLETFDAAKLASAAGIMLVDCSAQIPRDFLIAAESDSADHGHAHGGEDPHVWLSCEGAALQAQAMARAMATLDAANGEGYLKRADEFQARVMKLRDDYRARLLALPNRGFVTDHDAFAYFAREFELKNLGFLRKLPGKEPTLAERRSLEAAIRQSGAKAIFTEPGHDPAASETLARGLGVKLASLDPFEIGRPSATAYEETMRRNLEAVLEALK
ncbi:zinc ABC transporter substrate-binding protein [bacterium]|nr:MAG: zinc ABC transporter substrate-binding protein [bacterium]